MSENKKNYKDIIIKSGIFRYSQTKGSFILPPNGLIIWETIKKELDKKFSRYKIKNVLFPTLISLETMNREKAHLTGFSPEFFFVSTSFDKTPSLVLRPTSEVLFHEWFKEELITYKQLPFLYNQWVQVFRNEKNVTPFFRNSEFLWQEGHTLHESDKEAKKFSRKIINLYEDYAKKILAIDVIKGKKTFGEKFAGASSTYTIECILPNGHFLQLATSHYLSDNFSNIFKLSFRDNNNKLKIPFSTSWGTSSRALGAIVSNHSREGNIIFPFIIAPIQVSIIFINNFISEYKNIVLRTIKGSSLRWKLYDEFKQFSLNMKSSENEGSPLLILIGKEEEKNRTITIVSNYDKSKEIVGLKGVNLFLIKKGKKIQKEAFKKNSCEIIETDNLEELKNYIMKDDNNNPAIFLTPFCNRKKCEISSNKFLAPYSFRCIPLKNNKEKKKCIFCEFITTKKVYIGKSY